MKAKVIQSMLVLVSVCIIIALLEMTDGNEVSYSQAMQVIGEKNLNEVTDIVVQEDKAWITLKQNGKDIRYYCFIPNTENFIETVTKLTDDKSEGVNISIRNSISLKEVFNFLLIYLLVKWFWGIIFQIFGFMKSDKKFENSETFKDFRKMFFNDFEDEIKNHLVKNVKTSFNDVAGMENAKSALRDVAIGILEAEKYEKYGAKIPSGILLKGVPGTGKTLIAKALAGEIKVPFIQYSATEMSDKWVGESEKRVRHIFNYAKKNAPCIIFFDEIDAIAMSRKSEIASHEKKLLNELLTCLDGFTPRDGVIFIAATNLAESLDEAIKRPGRFDRIIDIGLPNAEEREAILEVHARNKKLGDEIDLAELACNTVTLSGADLANILNEAAIIQLKAGHECITVSDLNEAHRNVLFGPKSSRKIGEKEKHLTAIHELGHAIVSKESIKEISIIPRGNMGGYTWYNHTEEVYITSKKIKEELVSLLGGRAAEQIILGEVSTGAENDMERAWKMAYDYVVKYGMSDIMGPISITESTMSDRTKEIIFQETKKMISDAFETATKMIESKKPILELISKILENKETILGKEFYEIVETNNFSI